MSQENRLVAPCSEISGYPIQKVAAEIILERSSVGGQKYTISRSQYRRLPPPSLGVPRESILRSPKELFLFLTQWTCPHGFEDIYYEELLRYMGFTRDGIGNYYLNIPYEDGTLSTTAFMAHMDTAGSISEKINHILCVENSSLFVETDGNTILGADDRAGMTVLLYMVYRKIPGLYCLFVGEEVGCVGSSEANHLSDLFDDILRAISFDRKGYSSIITHQCGDRTCSDEFAKAVSRAFARGGILLQPDDTGLFTDSKEFMWRIPECTNISVGYDGQHSSKEVQDLSFLKKLCKAASKIDWDSIPAYRDLQQSYIEWKSEMESSSWKCWRGHDYSKYKIGSDTSGYAPQYGYGWEDDECDHPFVLARSCIQRIVDDIESNRSISVEDVATIVEDYPDEAVYLITDLLEKIRAQLW